MVAGAPARVVEHLPEEAPERSTVATNQVDVSVIIPTFHREKQVVEAVESALGQTGVSVEVIVLDDSAEGSAREAAEGTGDPRVRYVKQEVPSGGRPALVRNAGARLALGRFLHFLDDDDRLADGALAALARALDDKPHAGVAVGLIAPFGDDQQVLRHEQEYFREAERRVRLAHNRYALVADMLFRNAPLVNSACTIRREHFASLGGYDPSLVVCEDVDFFLRAIRAFGFTFVDASVLQYRVGQPSLAHHDGDPSRFARASRMIQCRYRHEHGPLEFYALKVLVRLREPR
ncbi:MAG: glycosyltransferase [Chloroflexi bacterium]|nr:glycosyltransferase [Chloroflexota bacterium]